MGKKTNDLSQLDKLLGQNNASNKQEQNKTSIEVNVEKPNLGWLFYKESFRKILKNETNKKLILKKLGGSKLSADEERDLTKNISKENETDFYEQLFSEFQPLNQFLKFQKTNETEREKSQSFMLETTYPGLLIGSGYAHEMGVTGELKLGFFFDHTTGMPIVPGSSVKGVLRSVFPSLLKVDRNQHPIKRNAGNRLKYIRELIDNLSFDKTFSEEIKKLKNADIEQLEQEIFEGQRKNENGEYKPISIYERDIFFDAIIVKSNNRENKFLASDYITPHGNNPLKNPTPLQFLKILPQVVFRFQFDLKDGVISAKAKKAFFQKILEDQGIGAKTNVGYGQFK